MRGHYFFLHIDFGKLDNRVTLTAKNGSEYLTDVGQEMAEWLAENTFEYECIFLNDRYLIRLEPQDAVAFMLRWSDDIDSLITE